MKIWFSTGFNADLVSAHKRDYYAGGMETRARRHLGSKGDRHEKSLNPFSNINECDITARV